VLADPNFEIIRSFHVLNSKAKEVTKGMAYLGFFYVDSNGLYQACAKTVCYLPTSVPLSWELEVLPLDLKRSPEAIQHKQSSKSWS
jgi:hypothetical protein